MAAEDGSGQLPPPSPPATAAVQFSMTGIIISASVSGVICSMLLLRAALLRWSGLTETGPQIAPSNAPSNAGSFDRRRPSNATSNAGSFDRRAPKTRRSLSGRTLRIVEPDEESDGAGSFNSRKGGARSQAAAAAERTLANLVKRYPEMPPDVILRALQQSNYHGGKAELALLKEKKQREAEEAEDEKRRLSFGRLSRKKSVGAPSFAGMPCSSQSASAAPSGRPSFAPSARPSGVFSGRPSGVF